MAPEDVPKAAIVSPFGLYAFPVMTFGFRNAWPTFQRYINPVLGNLDFVFVYLNDILIASTSEDEHQKHLEIVLSRLNEYELREVNLEKYKFGVAELVFRRDLITPNSFKPNPEKVKAIQECPLPQTIQELRRFLGLVNSYRRLLANAAHTQRPLNEFWKGAKKRTNVQCSGPRKPRLYFRSTRKTLLILRFSPSQVKMQSCLSSRMLQTLKWEQPSSNAPATFGNH